MNAAPLIDAEFTVTGTVPVDLSVTDFVVDAFTATLPKERLVVLMVSAAVAAFNWSASACELLPALAVMFAVCAVVTEATVAENVALFALAGTVTVGGTVTAASLLNSLTLNPPVGAGAVSVTVHASVPVPVNVEVVQASAMSAVLMAPVPLRATVVVGLVEALLLKIKLPLAAPAPAGTN